MGSFFYFSFSKSYMTSRKFQNYDFFFKLTTFSFHGAFTKYPISRCSRQVRETNFPKVLNEKMLNYVKCPTLNWHFPPFLMKAKIDEKYHLSTLRVKIAHRRSFWFNISEQSQSSIIQGPGRGSHPDDPINGGVLCNNRASKAPNRLWGCSINFLSAFKGLQMLVLAWDWNTFRGALSHITVIGYLT